MRTRTWLSCLVLSFTLAAPAAFAADRFYLGITGGEEVVGGDVRSTSFGFPSSGDDRSYKAFVGIGLSRGLALEVAYHDFGNRQAEPVADFGYDLDLAALSGTVLWVWPVRQFDFFAKLGWMEWEEEGSLFTLVGEVDHQADGSNLLYGAGVQVPLGQHFALRGEWERFEFASGDEDALAAGLELRF